MKTIANISFKGKAVLIRVEFNVPLEYDNNVRYTYEDSNDYGKRSVVEQKRIKFLNEVMDLLSDVHLYIHQTDNTNKPMYFVPEQIVEQIFRFMPGNKVVFTDKKRDPRNYKVDFSKIYKVLNFKIEYTVNDGIEEMINFFKENKKILNTFNHTKFGNNIINIK